jgi:hypothetical protein
MWGLRWPVALLAVLLLGVSAAACNSDPPLPEVAKVYEWGAVPVGGGGYVTGLSVHPLDANIVYARTDIGGAYAWEPKGGRWLPMLDEFADNDDYYVEALVVDPTADGKEKVYVALGNGPSRDVLRSASGGAAGGWTATGLPANVKIHGNADFRWAADRLAIDPNKPDQLWFGTRENGLYVNEDIAASTREHSLWKPIPLGAVPAGVGRADLRGTDKVGITFVAFDAAGGTDAEGNTKVMYVGVFGNGVYRSTDGGATFSHLADSPAYPVQGKVDAAGASGAAMGQGEPGRPGAVRQQGAAGPEGTVGLQQGASRLEGALGLEGAQQGASGQQGAAGLTGKLFVTFVAGEKYSEGGVAVFGGGTGWTDITPGGMSAPYGGLDVDPLRPGHLVVAVRKPVPANPVYYSADGGATWSGNRTPAASQESRVPWWPKTFFASALSSVRFAADPAHPDRVWFSDWYGVWRTEDIAGAATRWQNFEQGHEEVVVHALTAPPPKGGGEALMFSGVADVGGFRHASLSAYPTAEDKYRPVVGKDVQDTDSIAVFEGDNNIVYRVGNTRNKQTGNGWKSTDNGRTWSVAFNPETNPSLPDSARGGVIAVSALNADTIVWVPLDNVPYLSMDGGMTWKAAAGISKKDLVRDVWDTNLPLAANLAGSNRFYIYKPGVGFYVSGGGNGSNGGGGNNSAAGSVFTQVKSNGLPAVSKATTYGVAAVPNQDGGVWMYLSGAGVSGDGVYVSTDGGGTFVKLVNVQSAVRLAFGAAPPGGKVPAAVYLWGKANQDKLNSLYRSDDMGATWTIINDEAHRFGSGVKALAGDRAVYGRVFVGTSGRGIYYGQFAP